VMKG